MNRITKLLAPLLLVLLFAGNAAAVSIGQWEGSGRMNLPPLC
ncbi:MAG: hypothetical protein PHC51_07000 [bacterium]|nr:hypothetical protein [bacterium]